MGKETIDFCGEKVKLDPDNDFAEMAAEAQRQADLLRNSSEAEIADELPAERDAVESARVHAKEAQSAANKLARKAKLDYARIDLSFMKGKSHEFGKYSWERTSVPKFAIMPVFGEPTMVLPDDSSKAYMEPTSAWKLFNATVGKVIGRKAMSPLPEPLQVFKEWRESSSGREVARTCRMSFVVPAEAKQAIADARKDFSKDELFFLAETTKDNWKVEITPTPMMLDPLVVAVREDEVYYITKFDPTPLEDYASKEFTH
jgi:hypothetical protein